LRSRRCSRWRLTWRKPQEPEAAEDLQQPWIEVLQSDAPKADKAMACKRLNVYGDGRAVPFLAPLLLDAELSSWARIALEAIPDPAADEALRSAMDLTSGRLLIGVINSIGVREDAQAVEGLAKHLSSPDAEVASAAAVSAGPDRQRGGHRGIETRLDRRIGSGSQRRRRGLHPERRETAGRRTMRTNLRRCTTRFARRKCPRCGSSRRLAVRFSLAEPRASRC
jgi:hypothetical protein